MKEHKTGKFENAFTRRYNFDRLVYLEAAPTVRAAARREKQLKGWSRARKVALIESFNPDWADLSSSWIELLRF
jgi:putative endonuclease